MTTKDEHPPASDVASDVDADEITHSDAEWPVAPLYLVEPEPDLEEASPEPLADEQRGSAAVGEPRARRLRPGLGTASLAGVLLLLLVAGAAVAFLSRSEESHGTRPPATSEGPGGATATTPTTPAALKEVPHVAGLDVTRARSMVEKADLRVSTRTVESDRPKGVVTSQSPEAGARAALETVIVLTVSSGLRQVPVPDVVGLQVSTATEELRAAGLRPELRLRRSAEPAGTVLGQKPSSDEKVDPESVVRLEVAQGPPKVVMPRLVGSWSSVAQRRLRKLGLRWTLTDLASAEPRGTVIGQSPNAGAQLRQGQTVTLEVSTGPAEVTVPDVTRLDEQAARRELEAAGFDVRVRDEPTSDPAQDGLVVDQDPASGTEARKGAVVTLSVARLS
jgi:serine/threonine-protein kinase